MTEKKASEQDAKLALRLAEVAELLSLSARTVWGLADAGEIKSFKVGTARLFSVDAIQQWIRTKEDENVGH